MSVLERAAVGEASVYASRARYHSSDNNFTFSWPPVPARQFLAERDRAFDPRTPTGLIPLDASDDLATPYPATTPLMLLQYLKLRAGEAFETRFRASGEVYYVMRGAGESRNGDDLIEWSEGDLFCFAGGVASRHRSGAGEALLILLTNEPLLAFEGLNPPAPGEARIETVHWRAAEIAARFEEVWKRPITPQTTGHAVLFSSPALAPSTNTIPSLNVAMNSLEAGRDQRPHRHNGVAVTLSLQGAGVHSLIDGERKDWSDGAATVTPPAAVHSHHNRGNRRMLSLVFQDEGLHYYTRTPGFSFA